MIRPLNRSFVAFVRFVVDFNPSRIPDMAGFARLGESLYLLREKPSNPKKGSSTVPSYGDLKKREHHPRSLGETQWNPGHGRLRSTKLCTSPWSFT